jgi:hypothetical protein
VAEGVTTDIMGNPNAAANFSLVYLPNNTRAEGLGNFMK